MTHNELVDIAYKWVIRFRGCGFAFKEFKTVNKEIPDVIGFGAFMSVVVECKVSRADFLSDRKKAHRKEGMGKFRFFMCPKGLIGREELPAGWGLLYVEENGRIKSIYNPYNQADGNSYSDGCTRDMEAENRLMYCALRRMEIRGLLSAVQEPLSKR